MKPVYPESATAIGNLGGMMHLSLNPWNEHPGLLAAVKMGGMTSPERLVGLDLVDRVHLEKPGDSSLPFNVQERAPLPVPVLSSAEGAAFLYRGVFPPQKA